MRKLILLAVALSAPGWAEGGPQWSPQAAASYLDGRIAWWMDWPQAKRDHDSFCISCHTALPYSLGRPALRTALGESAPTASERRLLDDVIHRVRLWNETAPFYPDTAKDSSKTAESRGTESILNALILASFDARQGKLSDDTRLALHNMWGEQIRSGETEGAFPWLQFHNAPWEGDSQFYGSTLAALAVGLAPGGYRDSPEIRDGLKRLSSYLVSRPDSQTLMDRVVLVWASNRLPGMLTAPQRQAIIDEALTHQQDDGGFSLSAFVGSWKRKDGTPLETRSDGYATAMVVLALQGGGVPRDSASLKRAVAWLSHSQEAKDGRWLAYSVNKQRDLASDVGRFMSDAATAYSVLALEGAR